MSGRASFSTREAKGKKECINIALLLGASFDSFQPASDEVSEKKQKKLRMI